MRNGGRGGLQHVLLAGMVALLLIRIATASAVTSQLGHHPNSYKEVMVYTAEDAGTFDVINSSGAVVYQDNLTPSTCQGGQDCLVGRFSNVSEQGQYEIATSTGEETDVFPISQDVFTEQESTFLEFFEANRQVDSAYHADLHKAQEPKFSMQADGSFIHEAWMAATTLTRLGSAYQTNPDFFTTDKYTTLSDGELDILETIRQYTDYLVMLQNATSDKGVSTGWNNDFGCGTVNPDEEKWNTEPEDCMTFINNTKDIHTAQTLLAYTQSLPALEAYNASHASQIVQRAEDTASYLEGRGLNGGARAFYGAALFQLYDHTGNATYLQRAYDTRDSVAHSIAIHNIQGNEFYWEEYVTHRSAMEANGLNYTVGGKEPATFFDTGLHNYSDGEGVLEQHGNFQLSRTMLTTALYATKKNMMVDDHVSRARADAHIAWLTGMNSIQDGHGDDSTVRRSFIFGIGTNPETYHSRLNPDQQLFQNGIDYIPGWVSGVYDSNGDGIYNHADNYHSWRFTETTNHIVALAIENFAYIDAAYKNATRPVAINSTSRNITNETGSTNSSDDENDLEKGLVLLESDGLSANFSCKPANTSDDLVVDWSFGDGTSAIDVSTTQQHEYNSTGEYYVQCDVWDNTFTKFISEHQRVQIGNETAVNDTESGNDTDNRSGPDLNNVSTGLTRDTDGNLTAEVYCNPENASDDLTVDWSFGDGTSTTDGHPIQTHAYPETGSYYVQCTAWDNVNAELTTLQEWFRFGNDDTADNSTTDGEENTSDAGSDTGNATVTVKEWYPQGNDYVFVCENGELPYEWEFGDGHSQSTSSSDVYHTYDSPGNHTVTCTGEETVSLNITIDNGNQSG